MPGWGGALRHEGGEKLGTSWKRWKCEVYIYIYIYDYIWILYVIIYIICIYIYNMYIYIYIICIYIYLAASIYIYMYSYVLDVENYMIYCTDMVSSMGIVLFPEIWIHGSWSYEPSVIRH